MGEWASVSGPCPCPQRATSLFFIHKELCNKAENTVNWGEGRMRGEREMWYAGVGCFVLFKGRKQTLFFSLI